MGAEYSQFKQSELVKHIPDLAKIEEEHALANAAAGRIVAKSHSSYTHFSDYSMFPDRFNDRKSKPKPILGRMSHSQSSTEASEVGSGSGEPNPFPTEFETKALANHSSVPASSGLISRYNFRLRRASESYDPNEVEQANHQTRARSLSNSKMYYFDFSLIPDKDPHCAQDECKRQKRDFLQLPKAAREILAEESMLRQGGSSVPSQDSALEAETSRAKRIRKTSEPRFGFFDYSMIPDKDPRFYSNLIHKNPDKQTSNAKATKDD